MAGRTDVRTTLATYLTNGNIYGVNQVYTSFPKIENLNTGAIAGQASFAGLVVFIMDEKDSRIAVGGAASGWKRVDYTVSVQILHQSYEREAEAAMAHFDLVVESLKERLRADRQFGDATGNLVWQGANPSMFATYAEPEIADLGVIKTWCALQFPVTQMIQA